MTADIQDFQSNVPNPPEHSNQRHKAVLDQIRRISDPDSTSYSSSSSFPPPPPPPTSVPLPQSTNQKLSWPLTSFENTIQNVCCISFLLGGSFAFNLSRAINSSPTWRPLHVYFITLTLFHLLEFLVTAIWNPTRLRVDSFLLNNGLSYYFAQSFCITEYVISHKFLKKIYHHPILSMIGLGCLTIGQVFRTSAMVTAAESFNHQVSTHKQKREDHKLVTYGIYRFTRHPSYLGFFWWSLGIQIYLGNWLSFLLFFSVLWKFFDNRIRIEERHLIKFFGKSYIDYKSKTPTYIPFIK